MGQDLAPEPLVSTCACFFLYYLLLFFVLFFFVLLFFICCFVVFIFIYLLFLFSFICYFYFHVFFLSLCSCTNFIFLPNKQVKDGRGPRSSALVGLATLNLFLPSAGQYPKHFKCVFPHTCIDQLGLIQVGDKGALF